MHPSSHTFWQSLPDPIGTRVYPRLQVKQELKLEGRQVKQNP